MSDDTIAAIASQCPEMHGLWRGRHAFRLVGRGIHADRPGDGRAYDESKEGKALGKPLFVQISDTHIGFNKEANPDVNGTLTQTIDIVNGMSEQPALIIHTGDITHLSKPAEFDLAQQLFSRLRTTRAAHGPGRARHHRCHGDGIFQPIRQSLRQQGLLQLRSRRRAFPRAWSMCCNSSRAASGRSGQDQLAWVAADLKGRSASTPIVVFAHMPLWTIYEPWGWGTGDADQLMSQLRRFGSVTVLNGHIHQIVQKVEGNMTFHTARSTAYPQPLAGEGSGPGPLKVAAELLPKMLGVTSVNVVKHPRSLMLNDTALA